MKTVVLNFALVCALSVPSIAMANKLINPKNIGSEIDITHLTVVEKSIPSETNPNKKSVFKTFRQWAIRGALFSIIPIAGVGINQFYGLVKTDMSNSGNTDTASYKLVLKSQKSYQRGDVISFSSGARTYAGRIIGMPGETIRFDENRIAYNFETGEIIEGQELATFNPSSAIQDSDYSKTFKLENTYLILQDNRGDSKVFKVGEYQIFGTVK